MIEFSIIDAADQSFGAIINNQRVSIRLRYNVSADRWTFDLSIDDLPVLHGRRIVAGADLVAPFGLGLGRIYAVPVTEADVPDRDGLPDGRVRLIHIGEGEL